MARARSRRAARARADHDRHARRSLGDPGGEEVSRRRSRSRRPRTLRRRQRLNNLAVWPRSPTRDVPWRCSWSPETSAERMGDREQLRFPGRKPRPRHLGRGSLGRGARERRRLHRRCESVALTCRVLRPRGRGTFRFARGDIEGSARGFRVPASSKTNGASRDLQRPLAYPRALAAPRTARRGAARSRRSSRVESPPGTRTCASLAILDALLRRRARDRAAAPRFRRGSLPGRLKDVCPRRARRRSQSRGRRASTPPGSCQVRRMRGRLRQRSCSGQAIARRVRPSSRRRSRSTARSARRSSSSAARRCWPRLRAIRRRSARSGRSCRRCSRPPRRRRRRARRGGRRSAARRRGRAGARASTCGPR